MAVWRSKDDHQIELTARRRRIDIVAYDGQQPIALIEIESDLGDLRSSGVTRRNGHYDVWSIAADENGAYFDSYKSLERMASAAVYYSVFMESGEYPKPEEAIEKLLSIRSSEPEAQNPLGLD